MENLKKRRYEYFLYRYYNNAQIIERLFGTKSLGLNTYDETILLLKKAGFYDDNFNIMDYITVDLADFKTKNSDVKYDVKIDFSYIKVDDFTPCVPSHDLRYEDDEEETWSYSLITKIYFDELLVGEYESGLEMEYHFKYFVYNINKAFSWGWWLFW